MTCIQKSEVPPWDFFSLTRLTRPNVGGLDFSVKMSQNVHFFTVLHLYCVFLMSLHFLRLAVEMLTTTCIWRSNFTRYIFQKKKNKKYKHFRALLFSNGHRQPKHAHKERLQISNWRFAKLKQILNWSYILANPFCKSSSTFKTNPNYIKTGNCHNYVTRAPLLLLRRWVALCLQGIT